MKGTLLIILQTVSLFPLVVQLLNEVKLRKTQDLVPNHITNSTTSRVLSSPMYGSSKLVYLRVNLEQGKK